jgi:hypothetical protein
MAGFEVIMYGRFWVITEARMRRFPSSSSSPKKALKKRMASVRHHAERTATPFASELRPSPKKQNRRNSHVPGAAMSMSLPRAAATSNTGTRHQDPPSTRCGGCLGLAGREGKPDALSAGDEVRPLTA